MDSSLQNDFVFYKCLNYLDEIEDLLYDLSKFIKSSFP